MNALGQQFKVTSFGESHGSYVGCVIEGVPAGLTIDAGLIQAAVDRRKTGKNTFSSERSESDQVEIISGVYENRTLGSPVCILIKNEDARPGDYENLKDVFRPGHADATYHEKYQFRDHRGGGRSSIRITAPMVAAGELAKQLLTAHFPIDSMAFVSQIGTASYDGQNRIEQSMIEKSAVRCPDEQSTTRMLHQIEEAREAGDTLGGSITCIIKHVPAGLGEPVFGKLQAQLAHAMLNINTAKAFEYGEGIGSAAMKGSEHNDVFVNREEKLITETNHHGGILGGISSGMDIRFKVYFKPISSIRQRQETLKTSLEKTTIEIKGRHDVCAVPRAVPVVEAYTYIVLADLFLQNKISTILK